MISELVLVVFLGAALAYPSSENLASIQPPLVTTALGQIQGSVLKTRLGKPIYAFRGIRYAKPPINELRFQPPVPTEKWEGIYNATQDGPSCPQPNMDPTSEDCLLLNVYSTKLPRGTDNTKRPVIVFFHAGGFYSVSASSIWTGPQYLMDQDIVLVTANYRLGSLGFLSTGDKLAPGNNGLRDQVQTLKWVKDNIASFGGDPHSVTIVGYSAGAWSVTLHLVSPMSRGLFHKAIAMSGSSLGNWPIPTHQLDVAKKQAKLVGCAEDTSENIVKCLKTKSANELGDSLFGFREFGNDPVLIWSPVIEEDFGQERFLTDHPVKLISEGKFAKVPIITGVTTDEFANRAFDLIANMTLMRDLDKEFERYAPIAFLYERNTDNSKAISKALRTFYLNNKRLDNTSLPGLAQLYADALVGFAVNRAAKLLSEKNSESVYYYRFNYKGRYSHFYLPDSNGTNPYGVVHHDDLIYLFYISKVFPEFKESDPESLTVNKLTTLWANFARTGKPIPEPSDKLDDAKWEPFTIKSQKYLDIGNKLVLSENLNEKRYAQWEQLFPLAQYMKEESKTKTRSG